MPRRLPRTIHEVHLPPLTYVDYTMGTVGSDTSYIIEMKSSHPVDVLVMDEGNFDSFEAGDEFVFYGEKATDDLRFRFRPPKRAVWLLVVGNRSEQDDTVVVLRALPGPF